MHLLQTEHQPVEVLQLDRVLYMVRLQNGNIISANHLTPALATCQPPCECPETIPPSPNIIHMSDEELGCPGNFRREIFAHLPKFQGSLQKH